MRKRSINLTKLAKKYGPGYVVRIEGTTRIIGYAKQADSLLEKIKNKREFQEDKVIISWIPKYGARYVFLTIDSKRKMTVLRKN